MPDSHAKPTVEPVERAFDQGRIRLHTLVWNHAADEGPPVLLLHGLTGTAAVSWSAAARHLVRLLPNRPIYAPDLPGHGASDRPHSGYTVETLADDLAALIRQLPGARAGVVGHSLGAVLGLVVAAEQPPLVWRLVMVDSPLDTRHAPGMQRVVAMAHEQLRLAELPEEELLATLRRRSSGLTERAIGSLAARFRQVAPHALRQIGAHLWGVDPDQPPGPGETWRLSERTFMEEYLPRVQCPTLLVQADPTAPALPSVLPPSVAERALQLLPRARLVTYRGAGHLVNVQAPERLARDIAAWMRPGPPAPAEQLAR